MATAAKSGSVDERARCLYENHLSRKLEVEHPNEFVAIEPDSGNYFLGQTLSDAIQAARRACRLPCESDIGRRYKSARAIHEREGG